MVEELSITRIKLLHPKLAAECQQLFLEAVKALPVGVHPIITEGYRTFQESNDLYAQGRTKPGPIVTNARGGSSYHNYGLAIDFVIMVNGQMQWSVNNNWMKVVNIFKAHGWEWGGNWKHIVDNPHLQKTFGYDWRDLLIKYTNKDFIPGTEYVNI